MNLQGERIHCLGIAGIGVSAVAGLCSAMGAQVSGCDVRDNEQFRTLQERGCTCLLGHSPEHLDGVDAVVYSSAIRPDNPELRAARARGLAIYSRAQMLARLQSGKQTIGIAGAHGKSTTTWLTAHTLITAGLQPSVMVGGQVTALGGNWCAGSGPHFVIEVDESDGSLLEFEPTYSIITNIDREHLDYYRDFDHICQTFAAYVRRTRDGGCVIGCSDDRALAAVLERWPGRTVSYGLDNGRAARPADFTARSICLGPRSSSFEVVRRGEVLGPLVLTLPGEHNVQNALAVVALASELGISLALVREAFACAVGVGRRLQWVGDSAGVSVLDDYGHHPREIRATLAAARRMASGRLIGVFQPHRYTRTKLLCEEFGVAFDELDHLLLAPIYAASEPAIEGVSSQLIARQIERDGRVSCEVMPDLASIADRLLTIVSPGDTVITMGAGDVYRVGDKLLRLLQEVRKPLPAVR